MQSTISEYLEIGLQREFKEGDIVYAFESDEDWPLSWSTIETVTVRSLVYKWMEANQNNKNYFRSWGKNYLFYGFPPVVEAEEGARYADKPVTSVNGNWSDKLVYTPEY